MEDATQKDEFRFPLDPPLISIVNHRSSGQVLTRWPAHAGSSRQARCRLFEKLPNRRPFFVMHWFKLSAEKRLIWPLRGDAYHQSNRWPVAICPSETSVLKRIIPSGLQSIRKLSSNASISETCSKTSNAVTKSKLPKSSIESSGLTKGS